MCRFRSGEPPAAQGSTMSNERSGASSTPAVHRGLIDDAAHPAGMIDMTVRVYDRLDRAVAAVLPAQRHRRGRGSRLVSTFTTMIPESPLITVRFERSEPRS